MIDEIRVIIADDSQIFRKGLKFTLAEHEDIKIVGEANEGKELLKMLSKVVCDVILLDLKMPVLNGMEVAPLIREKYPRVKIIVLTIYDEDVYIVELVRTGVHSYLLKDEVDSMIVADTIRTVMRKGLSFDAKISKVMQDNFAKKSRAEASLTKRMHFSPRDLEVLKMLCKGFSNEKIAEALSVSIRTVEWYRAKLKEITGSKDIVELIAYAHKHSLVDL